MATDNARRGAWAERYQTAAVVFLNTALLLVALELAAAGLLEAVASKPVQVLAARVTGRVVDVVGYYESHPYYASQEWSRDYWEEFRRALSKAYHPYVVWRSREMQGRTIAIDERGVRRTPGAVCRSGAYTVYTFGGSAMWGWGAPDWATIPAYLQEMLATARNEPVCVVNFGENAFVSTQSVMQLVLLLASGARPDAVLFYEGVNDVLAAHQSGEPGLHQNYVDIAGQFEPRAPLVSFIRGLRTYELAERAVSSMAPGRRAAGGRGTDAGRLADRVAAVYLANYGIVDALSRAYGFAFVSFVQPYVLMGRKTLTADERRMFPALERTFAVDADVEALFKHTYDRIEHDGAHLPHLRSLVSAFDGEAASIWIDTWGHVTPDGNRIIARLMAAAPELQADAR